MKIFIRRTFCLLCLFYMFSSQASQKSVIAIFDFYGVRGRASDAGSKLSLLIFAQLSLKDGVKMVEREEIDKIIRERKLKRSGLVKQNFMEIAALVNADYIITGRMYDAEGSRIINLKLTKCSDGKISGKMLVADPKKKDYLENAAIRAATYIAKKITPEKRP